MNEILLATRMGAGAREHSTSAWGSVCEASHGLGREGVEGP